jgi:hypothetical protein
MTLFTKIGATSYTRPLNEDIVEAVAEVLDRSGFDVAGPTAFAGRPAVMAAQDSCLVFVTPVSEQGWHEEAVKKAVSPGQSIRFAFKRENFGPEQPRWAPLLDFYASSMANYFGVHRPFEPVYAVVESEQCSQNENVLESLPGFSYKRGSALDRVVDDH